MKHNVTYDPTGLGRERWTCWICETQIIRQPYMTPEQWEKLKADWMAKHSKK